MSVASPWPTSRNVTRSPVGGGSTGSGAARQAIATSPAAAKTTASVLDLLPRAMAAARPAVMSNTGAAESCAYGIEATALAQSTRYAASQPSSHTSSAATSGTTGWTAAASRPSPSSGATTGAAIALAITEYAGTEPNWKRRIGAVATPQAIDTATTAAAARGSGYPSSQRIRRGTSVKIAATAENES